MKAATRNVLRQIVALYLCCGAIFAGLFYSRWSQISLHCWIDLGVYTAIILGVTVPIIGRDLKKPKVFALLLLFSFGHLAICLHFIRRGIWVRRPLEFAPIALAEVFVLTYALMWLGGAKFEDFRQSLGRRRHK